MRRTKQSPLDGANGIRHYWQGIEKACPAGRGYVGYCD
ncbi:MAG: hypothetical protein DRR06_15095 [Gammaproteobacteria bacterium]|nr:MAG: hypothetical protein DRR06_15095 [Gammaproteobacteria bacterium]